MADPRRLFVSELPASGGEVRLDPSATHHARVLRLEPGDAVVLFDGSGREAGGHVASVTPAEVTCRVEVPSAGPTTTFEAVLVLAMPKAGKLDTIVRMVTEAGATALHLAWTERALGRPDPRRAEAKMARLARVAREAARQAGRADVPSLHAPAPVLEVAGRAPASAVRLLADPAASRSLFDSVPAGSGAVWMVVGPEGGLSPEEIARLTERGFDRVRLGPYVLRVETAAPVAMAMVAERLTATAALR